MAAPTQSVANSFKNEVWKAEHNLSSNTIKMALFKAAASVAGTYNKSTTTYTSMTSDELANGSGYTTGGATLSLTATFPKLVNDTAVIDWTDPSWTTATFTTSGAMVYNDTHASDANIFLLNFGGDKSVTSGTFTVVLPVADDSTGIFRIA